MIYFDHCYTADTQHRFLRRLERLGFQLEPQEVEHPGRHFCRFIMLKSEGSPRGRTYLEFINVKPGGDPVRKPGISFGHKGSLEKFHQRFAKNKRYGSKLVHKNYNWKEDNRSRLPGWNFLTFQKLGFQGLFPWMTEYEPRPSASKKKVIMPRHKNGVQSHHGFVLELNEKSADFLSCLLGQPIRPRLRMKCGTELYITLGKRTRVTAVVLKSKNLRTFLRKYQPDEVIDFQGRPAARIVNPSGMYDILII